MSNTTAPMATDYNSRSAFQAELANSQESLFVDALDALSRRPAGEVFSVLELGCATGGNSVAWIRRVLDAEAARLRPVHVIQNDLAGNAWSEVFALRPQWERPGVTHAIVGRSFYEPLVPPASVDFCFSFTALHWGRNLLPFPYQREGLAAILSGGEKEDRESFLCLVKNARDALKSGGCAFWAFPSIVAEDMGEEEQYAATRLFVAMAEALFEVFHVSPEERSAFLQLYICFRSEKQVRSAVSEFADLEVLFLKKAVTAYPVHSSEQVCETLVNGIESASFEYFFARAVNMFPDRVQAEKHDQIRAACHSSFCSRLKALGHEGRVTLVMVTLGFRKK